jgi:hypothetical protein
MFRQPSGTLAAGKHNDRSPSAVVRCDVSSHAVRADAAVWNDPTPYVFFGHVVALTVTDADIA